MTDRKFYNKQFLSYLSHGCAIIMEWLIIINIYLVKEFNIDCFDERIEEDILDLKTNEYEYDEE